MGVAAGEPGPGFVLDRRRRRTAGAVALVGGFARRWRRRRGEPTCHPGVIELEEEAVVVLAGQRVEGREVDVSPVCTDPVQPRLAEDGGQEAVR